MDFVNWWKTSSQKAGAEHYALRFDENELNDLRGGLLNASAKMKFKTRLRNFQKLSGGILIGCGLPLFVIFIPFIFILGFGVYRAAGALNRSPIAWIWLGFVLLVLSAIVVLSIYAVVKLFAFKRDVAADLNNSGVAVERGNVDVKIISTRNGFDIQYWMNNVRYPILSDAVGSEIHNYFLGEANITGKQSYQTREIYRFYYLPASKLLLHFEKA